MILQRLLLILTKDRRQEKKVIEFLIVEKADKNH